LENGTWGKTKPVRERGKKEIAKASSLTLKETDKNFERQGKRVL